MSLFSKKPRNPRTSLQVKNPWTSKLDMALRDRSMLMRLGVVAVAIVLCVIAVQGWRSTFPYRIGAKLPQGVTSRVDFRILNPGLTERAQREAAAKVHVIFRHDSAPFKTLSAKLRASLRDIAEADRLEVVPDATRQAFGLIPDVIQPDDDSSSGSRSGTNTDVLENARQEFATLKNGISGVGEIEGAQIDQLASDFSDFVANLDQYGAIDAKDVADLDLKPEQVITVQMADGKTRDTIVADVQLAQLISETGRLGNTWQEFPRLAQLQSPLTKWLIHHNVVTLTHNQEAYDAAVRAVKLQVGDKFDVYRKGDTLLEPGSQVDAVSLKVLSAEFDAVEDQVPLRYRAFRVVIVGGMFTVTAVLFGFYLSRNEPAVVESAQRLAVFLGVIVLAIVLCRVLSLDPWRAELIPLTAAAMLLAIAYNQVLASMSIFVVTLVVTLSTVNELGQFVVLLSVSATSIIPLRRVPSRSSIIKVGFMTACLCFVVTWSVGIIQNQGPDQVWGDPTLISQSMKWSFWCVVVGFLVSGSLPFIEQAFGVVTDISLLEMSDVSHPLLQELVRRAPGTYNHSISVATIGETAADAIGANGLLVRVGAYFHDIGKMLKPEYFIENHVEGDSRHKNLAPAMSTLIIIGHVKDGADLARQHHLPERVVDFIEQHHGTTLVEYFFHEATRQADEDHRSDCEEASFRYPGPKPQNKEAGVMMLADAVESASRTLNEPAPKRIESLVHEVTMKRLLDGQFDESTLTLSEVHVVEESLIKSLIGIHHGRIKYPEQKLA